MCKFISCTKCKRGYHYRSECNDLPAIEARWHSWCSRDRNVYWAQKNKEERDRANYEENKQKHLQFVFVFFHNY